MTTAFSVREAAAITGRSKQGILKSIHAGRLSATRGANQEWLIEPVELARVFDIHTSNGDNPNEEVSSSCQLELDGCRQQVALLERIIREKDEVIRAKEQVIELTTAENARLVAVVAQLSPAKAKTGWWQRLLGGGA